MRFIGDVHAKFAEYLAIIDDCQQSIQVGDFGVGFAPIPEEITLGASNHRFIRGNHDDPQLAKKQPGYIPDGTVDGPMFFLGGGYSIDRMYRTEGVDWWPDEQLSNAELYDMVNRYAEAAPSILVCHECPSDVVLDLFDEPRKKWLQPSRTSHALTGMLAVHQPEMVIFGHWHQARDQVINGTRFICLPELGFMDIDI